MRSFLVSCTVRAWSSCLAELQLVDRLREARLRRAVDERERHRDLPGLRPDRLQHEQLVDVCVEQAADDRVELERRGCRPGSRCRSWSSVSGLVGTRRCRMVLCASTAAAADPRRHASIVRRRPYREGAGAWKRPSPLRSRGGNVARVADSETVPRTFSCGTLGNRLAPRRPASAQRLAPHEDAVVRRHRDVFLEGHRHFVARCVSRSRTSRTPNPGSCARSSRSNDALLALVWRPPVAKGP